MPGRATTTSRRWPARNTIEDSFAQALLEERLGEAHLELGELETARAYLDKSLAGFRNAGAGEYEALALYHLGRVANRDGQPELARRLFAEGLALAQQLGYYRQVELIEAALAANLVTAA